MVVRLWLCGVVVCDPVAVWLWSCGHVVGCRVLGVVGWLCGCDCVVVWLFGLLVAWFWLLVVDDQERTNWLG